MGAIKAIDREYEKDIIDLKDREELVAKKEAEFNKIIENIPIPTSVSVFDVKTN